MFRVNVPLLLFAVAPLFAPALHSQQQSTQPDPNVARQPFHGVRNNPRFDQSAPQPSAPPQQARAPFLPYQPPAQPRTAEQRDAAKRLGDTLPYLDARSEAGDGSASYYAGRAYEMGLGTPDQHPDLLKAVHFYTVASKRGILNGRYHAGYLMTRGYFDEPIAEPPHQRVQALYLKAQGDSLMTDAVRGGYNVRSEDILRARTEQGGGSVSSNDDAAKVIVVISALAFASGMSGDSSTKSSQDLPKSEMKFCTVPDTVRSADGTILWTGRRAAAGYQCP